MIDVCKASDTGLVRLLRIRGPRILPRPGTLSPDPWHFPLFASSMVQEQGDAATRTTSPMPLDCCGARGACQQSPILHSSDSRLSTPPAIDKLRRLRWPLPPDGQIVCTDALFPYHAIGSKRKMPGVWGQSPQEPTNMEGGLASAAGTMVIWESPFGRMFS
jgi:hypothetical protein